MVRMAEMPSRAGASGAAEKTAGSGARFCKETMMHRGARNGAKERAKEKVKVVKEKAKEKARVNLARATMEGKEA